MQYINYDVYVYCIIAHMHTVCANQKSVKNMSVVLH